RALADWFQDRNCQSPTNPVLLMPDADTAVALRVLACEIDALGLLGRAVRLALDRPGVEADISADLTADPHRPDLGPPVPRAPQIPETLAAKIQNFLERFGIHAHVYWWPRSGSMIVNVPTDHVDVAQTRARIVAILWKRFRRHLDVKLENHPRD